MRAFKFNNGADVYTAHGAISVMVELDTKIPVQRGRIPRQTLALFARELVAKNIPVEWTPFFPESLLTEVFANKPKNNAVKGDWLVTAVVDGKTETVRVGLEDIRAHLGIAAGQPSRDGLFTIAARLGNWGPEARIQGAMKPVDVRVGDLPAMAVESDAEASDEVVAGGDAIETDSDAEKPAEPVSEVVAETVPTEVVQDKPKGRRLVKAKAE